MYEFPGLRCGSACFTRRLSLTFSCLPPLQPALNAEICPCPFGICLPVTFGEPLSQPPLHDCVCFGLLIHIFGTMTHALNMLICGSIISLWSMMESNKGWFIVCYHPSNLVWCYCILILSKSTHAPLTWRKHTRSVYSALSAVRSRINICGVAYPWMPPAGLCFFSAHSSFSAFPRLTSLHAWCKHGVTAI